MEYCESMPYSFDPQHYAADPLNDAGAPPACEMSLPGCMEQAEVQQYNNLYSMIDLNEQHSGADHWAHQPLYHNGWSSHHYEMYADPPHFAQLEAIGNETDVPYPSSVMSEPIWDETLWSPDPARLQTYLAYPHGSIASVPATCPHETAIGSWPDCANQNDEGHQDRSDVEKDSDSGGNEENANWSGDGSDGDSDDDSDDSDDDDDDDDDDNNDDDDDNNDDDDDNNNNESWVKNKDRTHHTSRSTSSRGHSQGSEFQKLCTVITSTRLDTASISIDTIGQLLPRLHACRTCNTRFARPEHLQRHIRTVHEKKDRFACKVGSCKRRFPRADNLRAHYWTHVEGHGRRGRNEKMPLERLAAVIGRKEQKTIRRFRERLRCQQSRESATSV